MTNLKTVKEGFNKYCGPAVLSILTGKSTDECANVIRKVNGQYMIAGVSVPDLLLAAQRLGFDSKRAYAGGTLFGTIAGIAHVDGIYIISTLKPNHFVVIEVVDKKCYFCDNHTKEPIPAASSARFMHKVDSCYKVTQREVLPAEEFKRELKYTTVVNYRCDECSGYGSTPEGIYHAPTCYFKTEKEIFE